MSKSSSSNFESRKSACSLVKRMPFKIEKLDAMETGDNKGASNDPEDADSPFALDLAKTEKGKTTVKVGQDEDTGQLRYIISKQSEYSMEGEMSGSPSSPFAKMLNDDPLLRKYAPPLSGGKRNNKLKGAKHRRARGKVKFTQKGSKEEEESKFTSRKLSKSSAALSGPLTPLAASVASGPGNAPGKRSVPTPKTIAVQVSSSKVALPKVVRSQMRLPPKQVTYETKTLVSMSVHTANETTPSPTPTPTPEKNEPLAVPSNDNAKNETSKSPSSNVLRLPPGLSKIPIRTPSPFPRPSEGRKSQEPKKEANQEQDKPGGPIKDSATETPTPSPDDKSKTTPADAPIASRGVPLGNDDGTPSPSDKASSKASSEGSATSSPSPQKEQPKSTPSEEESVKDGAPLVPRGVHISEGSQKKEPTLEDNTEKAYPSPMTDWQDMPKSDEPTEKQTPGKSAPQPSSKKPPPDEAMRIRSARDLAQLSDDELKYLDNNYYKRTPAKKEPERKEPFEPEKGKPEKEGPKKEQGSCSPFQSLPTHAADSSTPSTTITLQSSDHNPSEGRKSQEPKKEANQEQDKPGGPIKDSATETPTPSPDDKSKTTPANVPIAPQGVSLGDEDGTPSSSTKTSSKASSEDEGSTTLSPSAKDSSQTPSGKSASKAEPRAREENGRPEPEEGKSATLTPSPADKPKTAPKGTSSTPIVPRGVPLSAGPKKNTSGDGDAKPDDDDRLNPAHLEFLQQQEKFFNELCALTGISVPSPHPSPTPINSKVDLKRRQDALIQREEMFKEKMREMQQQRK